MSDTGDGIDTSRHAPPRDRPPRDRPPHDRPQHTLGRAHPPDPDLVAERIARLTTDALVTRRGYLKILGVLSGGLALGNVAVALGAFRRRTQDATAEVVITEDADAVPVGGSVRFLYPGRLDPAVLIRLREDVFVAYSVVCTHLACEVLFREDESDLYCPCHNGYFDPLDGSPTAGPPERPLPEIVIERRGSAIVAIREGRLTPERGEIGAGEGLRRTTRRGDLA